MQSTGNKGMIDIYIYIAALIEHDRILILDSAYYAGTGATAAVCAGGGWGGEAGNLDEKLLYL